jgi:hypothetical protein
MKIIPEMAGPDFRPGLTSEEIEHIRTRTVDRIVLLMAAIVFTVCAFLNVAIYLPLEFYLLTTADPTSLLFLSLPPAAFVGAGLVAYILFYRRGLNELDAVEKRIYVDEPGA